MTNKPPAGELCCRIPGRSYRPLQVRDTAAVRVSIRVRPGAGQTRVGGEHDGALVVRVSARAVEGKATQAALAAVARAFGVRRGAVTLVTGATSRTKVIDIAGGEQAVLGGLLTQ